MKIIILITVKLKSIVPIAFKSWLVIHRDMQKLSLEHETANKL